MNVELQSRCWFCLPKEVREEIRAEYQNAIEGSDLEDFLIDFFGHHNLTSDTEPEEMLMVERKKVQEYKAYIDSIINGDFSSEFKKGHCYGQQTALDRLFGDKCLPDKELEHRLEQTSVQVESKFKIGEYVKTNNILVECGKILEISEDGKSYLIDDRDGGTWVDESDLEPYTEPETKDNTQQSSWEAEFKKMNECFEKMKRALSSLYETWGKIEDGINKLNRL